jgi:lambda family phage portal protein
MNIIDKTLRYFSPQTALKREYARERLNAWEKFKNSGYSESGASHQKKSMKGWNSLSRSPNEDINDNLDTLRQRSRSLFMGSPLAASAIKTNRTNVVGAGLKLKSKVDAETLGISEEQADQWERKVEKEFSLWAESVWADNLRLNNFYELQGLALMSWLMNGDVFPLIKRDEPKSWMPYTLRLHLLEGDRIGTPNVGSNFSYSSFYSAQYNTSGKNSENENPIYNGVEVDKESGAVVAYWVANKHPKKKMDGYVTKWKRVKAFGDKTGEPNILHLMEPERCEQYRGVPYLAPVIESLKQITRYTKAELTAAVVQSFFTAFIKQDGPANEIPFGETFMGEEQVDEEDPNSYEMGAGTINVLGEGESVEFGDPTRPGNNFEPFINAMAKQIGAALEIPYELLNKAFLSSYSASRAALLEAWKAFKMRRTWFANDFCQPVYELWLTEAVARGRIKAPGYFNDPAIKRAWASAEWIGPAPGQVDPVKEVTAAIMRIENGLSTRERETTELNGSNWDDNIKQLLKENKKIREAYDGLGEDDQNAVQNLVKTLYNKEIEKGATKID